MLEQRPGQKVFADPGWGVQVIQPAAPPADWWDPDNEGLSVVAAYRAINSAGTPWPGGPANYAESLVNEANPGTYDLVEGNGAVPWAAATGWGFVAAAAQYFDTGITPVNDQSWSMAIQYSGLATAAFTCLIGCGTAPFFLIQGNRGGASAAYFSGKFLAVVPGLLAGNLAISGNQGFRNGGVEPGIIPAQAGAFMSIYVGAQHAGIAPAQHVTANIESAVIYDATLTAPQVLAVATAMAAL